MQRVIYIMGAGRSGSTLLDMILGNDPRICSVGELKQMVSTDRNPTTGSCACGEPPSKCSFWSEVFTRWAADIGSVEVKKYPKRLRELLAVRRSSNWRAAIAKNESPMRHLRYQLGSLYRAISATSKTPTIVDSSKSPGIAYLLATAEDLDVRLIHLVRDGRRVVVSMVGATSGNLSVGGIDRLRNFASATFYWKRVNEICDWISTEAGCPSILTRYEDLAATPGETLRSIGLTVGESLNELGNYVRSDGLILSSHQFGGNRIRYRTAGGVRMHATDPTIHLSPIEGGLFSLIAGRGLARYDYRSRS